MFPLEMTNMQASQGLKTTVVYREHGLYVFTCSAFLLTLLTLYRVGDARERRPFRPQEILGAQLYM